MSDGYGEGAMRAEVELMHEKMACLCMWGCQWCMWLGWVHMGSDVWGVRVYDGTHMGKGRIVREECGLCGNGCSMRGASVVWICRVCDLVRV